MDISVSSSAGQLDLTLGACQASLDSSQAQTLRNQLAEVLLGALHQPDNYWQEQQAKLDELKHILPTLLCIDEKTVRHLLQGGLTCNWISIVRYTRKELPDVADYLLAIIGKMKSKFYCSLEEFIDDLHLVPASSIADVVSTLEEVHSALKRFYPETLPLLAEQKNATSQSKPSFNTRATTFLTNLSELPTSNLRLVLKSLTSEELGFLFSACKMLNITKFFSQLEGILPEKTYLTLEKKCPLTLEDSVLRALLSKLNTELKELKKLLKARHKV